MARHTVVLDASVSWKGFSLAPLWQLRAGRTDSMGEMPDWNTLDVNLSKAFNIAKSSLLLKFSARNILDCRYETVSGYPMPGRNFIAGVEFRF